MNVWMMMDRGFLSAWLNTLVTEQTEFLIPLKFSITFQEPGWRDTKEKAEGEHLMVH